MKAKKTFEDILAQYESTLAKAKEDYFVIPTGSMSLDLATGIGGIPSGKFTEIFGSEGTGKTTLALSISANAVNLGKKVLYVEPENSLTLDRIKKLFDANNNFTLVQNNIAEEALNICLAGITSGEVDVVILDSIGALVASKVIDNDLTDKTVALISSIMTVFLQKAATEVNNNNVAVILINQVRADFKNTFYTSYATPGGYALKHFTSMRISLTKGEKINKGDLVSGVNVNFNVVKNKLAPPFRSGYFPVMFNFAENFPYIDYIMDVVNLAIIFGVIVQKRGYFFIDEENIGHGIFNVCSNLAMPENKDMLDKIIEEVYNRYKEFSGG